MTLWHSRWMVLRLEWPVWVVGVIAPHGGMIVWSFCVGPLRLEWWPAAPEKVPEF